MTGRGEQRQTGRTAGEVALRLAQGMPITWSAGGWLDAARDAAAQEDPELIELVAHALPPAFVTTQVTGSNGTLDVREPALRGVLGRALRAQPKVLRDAALGRSASVPEALRAALDLDAAWLLAHTHLGERAGDRPLLELSRVAHAPRADVLALIAAMPRHATPQYWRDLLAHPILTLEDVRTLVDELEAGASFIRSGHWAEALLSRTDLDLETAWRLAARSVPRLWPRLPAVPGLSGRLLAAAATREDHDVLALLRRRDLPEAGGLLLLQGRPARPAVIDLAGDVDTLTHWPASWLEAALALDIEEHHEELPEMWLTMRALVLEARRRGRLRVEPTPAHHTPLETP